MNEYNNSQEYADTMEVTAKKILKIIGFVILGIGIVLIFSFSIMLLWNWLVPDIFGLRQISYFEGIGLLVLAKIFFGGLGGDSSSKSSKKENPNAPRDLISKAIHEEMQAEFKKEYQEKYVTNTQDTDQVVTEDLSNLDQDQLYEKWWENEGEKLFDSYLQEKTSK